MQCKTLYNIWTGFALKKARVFNANLPLQPPPWCSARHTGMDQTAYCSYTNAISNVNINLISKFIAISVDRPQHKTDM